MISVRCVRVTRGRGCIYIYNLFGVFVPDTGLITDAGTAISAIVLAAVGIFSLAFAWPVARKVYRVAKGALGSA